jgi:hypothetical protein
MLTLALLCSACAPTVEGASKAAAKGATGGSVQTLENPETRRRIAEIAGSPEVQKAIEEIAGEATTGAARALTDDEMAERTRRLAGAIAAETTKVALRTMADELPRTVGPAIESVGRDTASAVRSGLADPETRASLSSTVFELSRQAVLGSNEATAELERNKGGQGTVAHVSRIFTVGGVVLWVLLALLVLGVVLLSLALARTRAQLRRFILDRGVARDAASEVVEHEHRGPLRSPT